MRLHGSKVVWREFYKRRSVQRNSELHRRVQKSELHNKRDTPIPIDTFGIDSRAGTHNEYIAVGLKLQVEPVYLPLEVQDVTTDVVCEAP